MVEWKVYRVIQKITAQTRVEKIVGSKVPEGYILEVTFMSISNITTAGKVLELGYIDLAGEDRVVDINEGTNIHHHHITGTVYLEAGEAPFGRITTPTAPEVCYFCCHGKLWKTD